MRTKILTLMVMALGCILLAQAPAYAEDSSYEMIIVTIKQCASIHMFGGDCMDWTSGHWKPGPADFNATTNIPDHPTGWTLMGHVKYFLITANYPWNMTVEGTSPYFTAEEGEFPGAWQEKPVSNIVWSAVSTTSPIKSFGAYHELTCNPHVFQSGSPGKGKFAIIFFRVLLDWHRDTPGTYTYESVVFTLGPQ